MPSPLRRPLEITLPIRVQTYDIDFAGHVNNAVYIRWLEDLRMEFLRVHCPLESLMEIHHAPILYSTSIEYKKPVRLFDKVMGHMWCIDLGRATFHLGAECRVDGVLYTTATQRGVLIDLKKEKPARWPAGLRHKFLEGTELA
jgi:acyl-CoA thioester hydrolase